MQSQVSTRWLFICVVALSVAFHSPAQTTNGFLLSWQGTNEHGWHGIHGDETCTDCCGICLFRRAFRIDASTNLVHWQEVARLHDPPFTFFDPKSATSTPRFYRASRWLLDGAVDDWKNQISYKKELTGAVITEPFEAQTEGLGFVKFAILLSDPTRVYFQDTGKYPLHHEFAVARLPGFAGMSRAAFDAVSLRTNGQQIVLGTVLLPGDLKYPHLETIFDYGIQFVANDPLPPQSVRSWFDLVKSTVVSPVPVNALYVPSPSQAASVQANAAFYASNGISITSVDRWLGADTIYSHGWALGRLVYVPGNEINAAYFDGRLAPTDILLTDTVPAEVPFVAGIIALNAATPSSHVAILAQAYKIPFAFVMEEPLRSRLMSFVGRKVIFTTAPFAGYGNVPRVQVLDVNGQLNAAFEQEVLAYKVPPPVNVQPKQPFGSLSSDVTSLVPVDARYFGGKAANYGLLRRVIPTNSPVAIAFSMDLWDAFLNQTVGTVTLRTEISNRLAAVPYSPTNLPAIRGTLDGIRTLIRNASFNSPQRIQIMGALSGFPSTNNIRFRSSSNAEDSESFTAAGLLDSYSGCVADDTDGNNSGPSVCDPTEVEERGVYRAIQRVYASFYNDNAYLERARHKIDETKVGIGVLVHQSFPDPTELANGVATAAVEINQGLRRTNILVQLVTQPGAASVTNPSDDAQAEVAATQMFAGPSGTTNYTFNGFSARSSLLPAGITTMEMPDYQTFSRLIFDVSVAYRGMFPSKDNFTLDFEYKKLTNGWLLIKQVREIPPPYVTNVVPYLISTPVEFSIFQGEYGEAQVNHDLKLRGTFQTKNIQLTPANLAEHFFTAIRFQYNSNGVAAEFFATTATLTNVIHSVEGNVITDIIPATDAHPEFRFRTEFSSPVQGNMNPFVTLATITFGRQDSEGSQLVRLLPTPVVRTNSSLQHREYTGEVSLRNTNRIVTVSTTYYWPDLAGIVSSGYTAYLVQFVETTITGLTTEPLILTSHISQSYGTSHHNLNEYLLFEPGLDPGVSSQQRAELNALEVKRITLRVINPDRFQPLERSYQLSADFVNDD